MKSYPLKSISLEQAMQFQFRWIDCISYQFSGYEILNRGDLGVHKSGNIPQTTKKVERVIADFFNAEDAILVRGSGTNAIKEGLFSLVRENRKIFVHKAPIYSTTKTSFNQLNIETITVDFNDLNLIELTIKENIDVKMALVQITRQTLEDHYDYEKVIQLFKKYNIKVITDDNYSVLKVEKIGTQCGADLSCFSCFKLLGPQGIGCVVGKKEFIEQIRVYHYSGGSQVQGFEALEVLQGLIYAPVSLAIQAIQIDEIVKELNENPIECVKNAYVVNAQSKVILIELEKPIAPLVLEEAEKLGALPHPVGSESKYEFMPLFYKVSGTMIASNPNAKDYWIRINPMRAGKNSIIRILKEALKKVI